MGPLRFELRFRRNPHGNTMSRTPKDGPSYPTVPLLVWGQYIYKFHVGKDHSAATIASNAKIIKYLGRLFAFVNARIEIFPAA